MGTLIIRTSDRQYFKRCRELWDFTSKIRQNYEPIQRTQALDFGTAIHAGLQAYYEPTSWDDKGLQRQNAMEAFLSAIGEIQSKVRIGPLDFELQFDQDRELGIAMLEQYFRWAPAQDEGLKPIYVEVEFEVEIPKLPNVVYQGRIDLIVEDQYGYWIVDHKTAKQFGETSWLPLDDQCSSYAWAIQKQLGLEVRGVIYNELRKTAPHPPRILKNGSFSVAKNQDTSFEVYLKTLRDHDIDPRHYRDILLYLKQNPKEYNRRTRVEYTRKQLELVERRVISEAAEMGNDPAIYPTPSKFNCVGCQFFRPCLAKQEGSDYELILEELYEKRK